jgi:hypothetical protein
MVGGVVHFSCEGDAQTLFDEVKAQAERQGWTIGNESNSSSSDITNFSFQGTKGDDRQLIVSVIDSSAGLAVTVSTQDPS